MREDREQQVFQKIAGAFDEPAFLRRARLTHGAWDILIERAKRKRAELLKMPHIRLGRLAMLAPDFRMVERFWSAQATQFLANLHDEWQPKLRHLLDPTNRESVVAKEVKLTIESLNRFNMRWRQYVMEIDFEEVNTLRDGYNRYYVVEKECALQSFKTAMRGFKPLNMVGTADVLEMFPLLELPTEFSMQATS